MTEAATVNGFVRWLAELELSKRQAAILLGKTVRAIENYERGVITPPEDTRKLMAAIADGFAPKAWPA